MSMKLFTCFGNSVGIVSTFVGSGSPYLLDGIGTAAKFNYPRGLAVDNYGNIFVADRSNYAIRKVTPTGVLGLFMIIYE